MANTDIAAHLPPSKHPEEVEQDSTVYRGPTWNPVTNEWDPFAEPVSAPAIDDAEHNASPGHGDLPTASPMTNSVGDPRTYEDGGATHDERKNLLTDVRDRAAIPPPEQVVRHVIETNEVPSGQVRGRLVAVVGNAQPTTLLEQNPDRVRALISVFTDGATVILAPGRQGGIPQLVAAITQPLAGYPLVSTDPRLEIKSSDAVECYGITAAGTVLVRVWEELNGSKFQPGIG
jgi:hypothetical protein